MKNILYISAIFFIAISCKKNGEGEFIEKSISGNLYYVDSASGNNDKIVLPNHLVYLSKSESYDDYVLSTKSDSDGHFIFTHTPKNSKLYIFSRAEIDDKLFEDIMMTNDNENILILEPNSSSRLSLLINDNSGYPVNGLKTFLYTNYNTAFADSIAPIGNGFIRSGITNDYGFVYFTGLNSRTYFIQINDSINGIKYRKLESINYNVSTNNSKTVIVN